MTSDAAILIMYRFSVYGRIAAYLVNKDLEPLELCRSYNETFTINLTNVTEAPTVADATDAPTEDTANIWTTVNFGMRETNRISNAPSSGLSLLIESEEEGFRLPDGLQKTIEIKTDAPLTADIFTPGRNGPSAVSEKLSENIIATRETS